MKVLKPLMLSACVWLAIQPVLALAVDPDKDPELRGFNAAERRMSQLFDRADLGKEEKERLIKREYEGAVDEWKKLERAAFVPLPNYLNQSIAYYFKGTNQPSKSLPYLISDAETYAEYGSYAVYFTDMEEVIKTQLELGLYEDAGFSLAQVFAALNDYFELIDGAPFQEQDVYSLFYWQLFTDLKLRYQLSIGKLPSLAELKAQYAKRQQAQDAVPALVYMERMTKADDVNKMAYPEQRKFYHQQTRGLQVYPEAFAALGDKAMAREALRVLDGMYERNIRNQSALYNNSKYHSFYAAEGPKYFRRTVRSRIWQAWDRAKVEYAFGEYQSALNSVNAAKEQIRRARQEVYDRIEKKYAFYDQVEINDYRLTLLKAQINEQMSNFVAADRGFSEVITWSEKRRASMPIEERRHFFESFAKQAYLGRVRALARQITGSPTRQQAQRLVDYLEAFRSRQLKELLGTDEASTADLAAIQAQLGEHEAILSLSDLGTDLLSILITRKNVVLASRPKPEGWQEKISTLRAALVEEIRYEQVAFAQIGEPLLAGVRGALGPVRQLRVLSDGIASILPVGIMPVGDGRLLHDGREIQHMPSLGMFNKNSGQAGTKRALFALGDPAYQKSSRTSEEKQEYLLATRGSDSLAFFEQLPETRTEVKSIARSLGGSPRVVLGQDAAESMVKKADLSQYGLLHFATHGVLSGEVPDLNEPALVLAHEEGEDGFLTASEVAKLKLDADLTVLSACNTGNGEYFLGEGVMGMGRAFMIAGSRQVLVSLWPVESTSTEKLMVRFYRELGKGKSAARALMTAKEELRKQKAYSNPFFWSGFVLIGA